MSNKSGKSRGSRHFPAWLAAGALANLAGRPLLINFFRDGHPLLVTESSCAFFSGAPFWGSGAGRGCASGGCSPCTRRRSPSSRSSASTGPRKHRWLGFEFEHVPSNVALPFLELLQPSRHFCATPTESSPPKTRPEIRVVKPAPSSSPARTNSWSSSWSVEREIEPSWASISGAFGLHFHLNYKHRLV